MRRWPILILVVAAVWALSRLEAGRASRRPPFRKRLDAAINVLFWIVAAAYVAGLVYWLAT